MPDISTPANELRVDTGRLWSDVMALAAITDPEAPYTRRSFSPLFLQGRDWLEDRFIAAGLTPRIDTAGNLIGRREGSDPTLGTIVVGSHSDSVPAGGRFDGMAGLLSGLEIARVLKERGIALRHSLEIVDFLAEEPSEYGISCVGSRGMAAALDEAHLRYTNRQGETLADAIKRVGGDPSRLSEARRTDIKAAFELHIEQGPVLEANAIDIGLVTSIVGIRRIEIEFSGAADHAGTTPMPVRRDALVAAARLVDWIAVEASGLAASGHGYFVATTGILDVAPGAANVVPRQARLVVDIRSESPERMEAFCASLESAAQRSAGSARVELSRYKTLSATQPSACAPGLRAMLASAAATRGLSTVDIASGAGHDMAFLSLVAPMAMVFIPCRGGKSHCPEEWTEPSQISAGAATILGAVLQFDAD